MESKRPDDTLILCACAGWSKPAHFAHIRRYFFVWRGPLKRVLGHMRTAKSQISLRIRAVWSSPSLTANRITGYNRMYERRAKARVILCSRAWRSDSAHFARVRRYFFAWRGPFLSLHRTLQFPKFYIISILTLDLNYLFAIFLMQCQTDFNNCHCFQSYRQSCIFMQREEAGYSSKTDRNWLPEKIKFMIKLQAAQNLERNLSNNIRFCTFNIFFIYFAW